MELFKDKTLVGILFLQYFQQENQQISSAFKVGLSPSKKNSVTCFTESSLKTMQKACYFILNSFRSQDIQVFVMTFWSCWKNRLIRKIRLTAKFMTSQPGQQTIAILVLTYISWSKDNQTMKLGQLIKYNKNIFLE